MNILKKLPVYENEVCEKSKIIVDLSGCPPQSKLMTKPPIGDKYSPKKRNQPLGASVQFQVNRIAQGQSPGKLRHSESQKVIVGGMGVHEG